MNTDNWQTGVKYLQTPLWPLTRLCLMLYLTSPYEAWEELLEALPEELETDGIRYEAPARMLSTITWPTPWVTVLKQGRNTDGLPVVLNEKDEPLDIFSTILCLMKQHVMEMELERINSLLCSCIDCSLCCEGPTTDALHDFFEIPLRPEEVRLFDLTVIDTTAQGKFDPYSSNTFNVDETPFYLLPPAIYRWSYGYSLILTKGTCCPHLSSDKRCNIYPKRPAVCKKPQIFAYITEQHPERTNTLYEKNTVLAITDCPYIQKLEKELEQYAVLNEVSIIFKANKA